MFEQRGNTFTIYCDQRRCNETEEFETWGDFRQFIDEAKKAGWKISKDGSGWIHTCAACKEAQSVPSLPPSNPAAKKYVLKSFHKGQSASPEQRNK